MFFPSPSRSVSLVVSPMSSSFCLPLVVLVSITLRLFDFSVRSFWYILSVILSYLFEFLWRTRNRLTNASCNCVHHTVLFTPLYYIILYLSYAHATDAAAHVFRISSAFRTQSWRCTAPSSHAYVIMLASVGRVNGE